MRSIALSRWSRAVESIELFPAPRGKYSGLLTSQTLNNCILKRSSDWSVDNRSLGHQNVSRTGLRWILSRARKTNGKRYERDSFNQIVARVYSSFQKECIAFQYGVSRIVDAGALSKLSAYLSSKDMVKLSKT